MTASILKEGHRPLLEEGHGRICPKPFKVEQLISEIEKAHLSKK